EVAEDKVRATLVKQVAPAGVKASVVDVEKAVRVFNNRQYADDRGMVLFTTPLDAEGVIKAGIPSNKLNDGGLSYKEGKVQLNKSNFVNKEEADCLRRLVDQGVDLDVRGVVNDSRDDMIQLLNSKNI